MNENRGSRRGQNRHPPGNTGGAVQKETHLPSFLGGWDMVFKEAIILYISLL